MSLEECRAAARKSLAVVVSTHSRTTHRIRVIVHCDRFLLLSSGVYVYICDSEATIEIVRTRKDINDNGWIKNC